MLGGLALLGLAGCSSNWATGLPGPDMFDAPRQVRGHAVPDEVLAQITPGVTGRDDVAALLGSPSASALFEDNEWFYITGITRLRPGRVESLEQQQVVVVRFDQRGLVQEVQRLGSEARRDVQFVSRETPTPGNDRTLLQQLFGNLGRLGAGVGGAANQGGPGAATASGR